MYDLSIAHVDCHVTAIADQVSWLCICIRNFCSSILLLIGSSWQANAKVSIHTLYEAGAVCTTSKTGATPYIWITYKLSSIIYNRRS